METVKEVVGVILILGFVVMAIGGMINAAGGSNGGRKV